MKKGNKKSNALNSKTIKNLSVYINLLTDFGFKRVFGIKEVMLKFLNAVLNIEGGITDLEYIDTEILGLTKDDRKAVYDLVCVTGKGEHIIVEMQQIRQDYFKDRTLLYLAMLILKQSQKGRAKDGKAWNFKQPFLYIICIADFYLNEEEEIAAKIAAKAAKERAKSIAVADATDKIESQLQQKYYSSVKLMDEETKEIFYEKLSLMYIELPKFSKKLDEVKTFFEQWIYLIKNMHRLKNVPKKFTDEIFETVFETAKIAKMDKKQVYNYVKSLNDMNIVKNQFNRMSNTIASLQSSNTALQSSNTALQSSNTALQSSNTALQSSNTALKSSNTALQSENAAMQNQLEEYQRRYGKLN